MDTKVDNRQSPRSRALSLRLAGYTYEQIGADLGISRQRAQQILRPPKSIYDFVYHKAGGQCEECGLHIGRAGHIHHRTSITLEDYNDIENLQLLCISCHSRMHDHDGAKIKRQYQPAQKRRRIERDKHIIIGVASGRNMKAIAHQYHMTPAGVRQIVEHALAAADVEVDEGERV